MFSSAVSPFFAASCRTQIVRDNNVEGGPKSISLARLSSCHFERSQGWRRKTHFWLFHTNVYLWNHWQPFWKSIFFVNASLMRPLQPFLFWGLSFEVPSETEKRGRSKNSFQTGLTSDCLVSIEIRRMGLETAPILIASTFIIIVFVSISSIRWNFISTSKTLNPLQSSVVSLIFILLIWLSLLVSISPIIWLRYNLFTSLLGIHCFSYWSYCVEIEYCTRVPCIEKKCDQ